MAWLAGPHDAGASCCHAGACGLLVMAWKILSTGATSCKGADNGMVARMGSALAAGNLQSM